MQLTLGERLGAALKTLPALPDAVAVSGGGDSLALLHLLHDLGHQPAVVTVDHGLRPGSAAEARAVADAAAALGLPHTTLTWQGWDGSGNLQDHARRARRDLVSRWAVSRGLQAVALGHTRDDQAETVLMRLARGAGVDGLSAMRPATRAQGVLWLRPLLDVGREELRLYLRQRGVVWSEDPSNENLRFDRVRMRKAMEMLAPLGITAHGLAATAARMAEAREALDAAVDAAAAQVTVEHGDLVIERAAFFRLPSEIRRRLLVRMLHWIVPSAYPPRSRSLDMALGAVAGSRRHTIHGCLLSAGRSLRVGREPASVAGLSCPVNEVWDGRWRLSGPAVPGHEIRALGETGLRQLPERSGEGQPRSRLLASPAVWAGDRLVAAPLAGFNPAWRAELARGCDHHDRWPLSD
ncbi:tRNA lysidine(34) synthetase TilS [Halodurantibacterium flavum]|uniref:tRNA(Ile)-lysidine synthase n=1 Tax=Halodurantibacterium flavum TaxID=1382802 RepID=A0ABW4S6B5_9RHOB